MESLTAQSYTTTMSSMLSGVGCGVLERLWRIEFLVQTPLFLIHLAPNKMSEYGHS